MQGNLEFSEALTYHRGYTDYNIFTILLLYYKYPNVYTPINQPLMTLRGRFTKQRMQWAHAQHAEPQCHKNEALALPCSCPLKVSQCVKHSQAGAQDFGKRKDKSVNTCLLCACHSSSCEVIRVCLVLPPRWLQAEWETWPFSALFTDYILQCFLLCFHYYCGNLNFLVRQNHRESRNGNYIYPVFTAFHLVYLQFIPVFWGIFVLMFAPHILMVLLYV